MTTAAWTFIYRFRTTLRSSSMTELFLDWLSLHVLSKLDIDNPGDGQPLYNWFTNDRSLQTCFHTPTFASCLRTCLWESICLWVCKLPPLVSKWFLLVCVLVCSSDYKYTDCFWLSLASVPTAYWTVLSSERFFPFIFDSGSSYSVFSLFSLLEQILVNNNKMSWWISINLCMEHSATP